MTRIGSVDDISICLDRVRAADGILSVVLLASGPSAEAQAHSWHQAVESSTAEVKARGEGEPPTIPETPGNRVLLPIRPRVTINEVELPLRRDSFASIAGIDPPWQSSWRFVVPDHVPADSRVTVWVPALGHGPDDPVYVASLRDVLTRE